MMEKEAKKRLELDEQKDNIKDAIAKKEEKSKILDTAPVKNDDSEKSLV